MEKQNKTLNTIITPNVFKLKNIQVILELENKSICPQVAQHRVSKTLLIHFLFWCPCKAPGKLAVSRKAGL